MGRNEPLSKEDAAYLMALPFDQKWQLSNARIFEWADNYHGNVSVSFSGGKDSTVLAYLVCECLSMFNSLSKTVHLVFSNTGLEYLEIQRFVDDYVGWLQAHFPKLQIVLHKIRPKMNFSEVISNYGYPIIGKEVAEAIYYARRIRSNSCNVERESSTLPQNESISNRRGNERERKRIELSGVNGLTGVGGVFSEDATAKYGDRSMFNKAKWLPASQELPFMISHYCCSVMKKQPMHHFQRESGLQPFVGTLASESRLRKQSWMRRGCNAFESTNPQSTPMAFWTEQDVLTFIAEKKIPICSVYGDVVYDQDAKCMQCTGCDRTGCVFCMFGAHSKGDRRFFELAKLAPRQFEYAMSGGQWIDNPKHDPIAPKYDGNWLNWNPKKIWVPSKDGLGLRFVINRFNSLYPENQIKLP